MKRYLLLLLTASQFAFSQKIGGIQLFNPKTNDETPVIGFNDQLILRFDDFSGSSDLYRYTIKHYDRNWQDDNLFFTEFAEGNMSNILDKLQYSFNTLQTYTHYVLTFPNENLRPKVSGNFKLIVYKDSPSNPVFEKKFFVVENGATLGLSISRFSDATKPNLNQRVEVMATSNGANLNSNINSMSLMVRQNNNENVQIQGLKPSGYMGNQVLFQQLDLAFPGNNEFYYFDNKIIDHPVDMVANTTVEEGMNCTYLFPVWAYPLTYQYQPDMDGAFFFRRNDLGIERNPETEGDYSWVFFSLDSDKIDKDIYVLGCFNNYNPSTENQMYYDEASKKYIAKIYLKQGIYNYMLATKNKGGNINFGEINGNFWQTANLYQAFLYYTPFGQNYDGLLGYGDLGRK